MKLFWSYKTVTMRGFEPMYESAGIRIVCTNGSVAGVGNEAKMV